jgi:hypothetical protein
MQRLPLLRVLKEFVARWSKMQTADNDVENRQEKVYANKHV